MESLLRQLNDHASLGILVGASFIAGFVVGAIVVLGSIGILDPSLSFTQAQLQIR